MTSNNDPTRNWDEDLQKIFTGAWRQSRPAKYAPHSIYELKTLEGRVAVIVQRQSRPDGDWSLNATGLKNLGIAKREGRLIAAYIVQARNSEVLRRAEVEKVIANIGDTEPWDGRWGLYFWIDENFMPVSGSRGARNNNEAEFDSDPDSNSVSA